VASRTAATIPARPGRSALAREQLRDTDNSLAAIASTVGYTSEFAFAAAFKRHHGVAPGRWRHGPVGHAAALGAVAAPR